MPASGEHVWAQTYDRAATGVFAAQDDVTRDAVVAIASRLTGRPAVLAKAVEVPAGALSEFWKGRLERSRRTVEGRERSVTHFETAVRLAPAYAPAHAALGEVCAVRAFHGEADVNLGIACATQSVARRHRVRYPASRCTQHPGLDPPLPRLGLAGRGTRVPARHRLEPQSGRSQAVATPWGWSHAAGSRMRSRSPTPPLPWTQLAYMVSAERAAVRCTAAVATMPPSSTLDGRWRPTQGLPRCGACSERRTPLAASTRRR